MKNVHVYVRKECKLCAKAIERIEIFKKRGLCTLSCTEISESSVLYDRFRFDVPSVWVDDVLYFKHRVDVARLEAILLGRA